MKVYQIISENTVEDFKRKFESLTPQDQEAFKKLIAWEPSDTPNGTSSGIDGKLYTWNANRKRWIDSSEREVPPESPLHVRLFDTDMSDTVEKLYIEVRKADEVENLNNLLKKSSNQKPSTRKSRVKGKGSKKKKTRIGNLVRDMQKSVGTRVPSKEPGEGPD
jgi:hypothetical protein